MTYLAIGDLHFKKDNLPLMKKVCDAIIKVVSCPNSWYIRKVVFLGDTLHTHDTINIHCLRAAISFFEKIAQIIPIVVLIGNHDRPNNSDFLSDIHPFAGLKCHPNITIIDKPIIEHGTVYVPYVPPGRFEEALQTIGLSSRSCNIDVIFCHQEFKGVQLGAIQSEHGDEWPVNAPFVISGHIHDSQWVGNNVYYAGTPYQTTFSESSNKTIVVFNPGNRELNYIKLEGIPKFKTIRVTDKNLNDVAAKIKKYQSHHIKLVISADVHDVAKLKDDEEYKTLIKSVDKIEIKTTSETLSKAQECAQKHSGDCLEEIMFKLLENDKPCTLKFQKILSEI